MTEDCVFCSIVESDIPSHTIRETKNWMAFLDAEPVSRGHTLVIPKNHVENIHEVGDMKYLWDGLVETANAMREAFEPERINVAQNNGEKAGQEVFHLHFHVTPVYTGEEIDYDRSKLENGEETAEKIRESFR